MKSRDQQSGYTLLFAVIISSLVLSVAVFILTVSKKQFTLAVAARSSMKASYNAKAARECVQSQAFKYIASSTGVVAPTSGGTAWTFTTSLGGTVPTCNGVQMVQDPTYPMTVNGLTTTWTYKAIPFGTYLNNKPDDLGCAIISYTSGYDASTYPPEYTKVTIRGYNVCIEDPAHLTTPPVNYIYDVGNSDNVERAQEVDFNHW